MVHADAVGTHRGACVAWMCTVRSQRLRICMRSLDVHLIVEDKVRTRHLGFGDGVGQPVKPLVQALTICCARRWMNHCRLRSECRPSLSAVSAADMAWGRSDLLESTSKT